MVLRLDSTEPQWRPLLDSPGFEHFSAISPSGTMLAYAYSENKIPTGFPVKAFAAPYPDVTADRWPLSREIASELTWARSGREVFFETRGQLVGVTVEPGRPTPRFGPETDLFAISPYLGSQFPGTDYDTAPDGRFLMIKNPPPTVRSRTITVVTHWIDELKERVKGPSQP